MFRRLYWIVEQVNATGTSQVTGIYTSIQDLLNTGLQWAEGMDHRIRLSLWKPDCFGTPLGVWNPDSLGNLSDDLQAYIATNEYTPSEVMDLVSHIDQFLKAAA